MLHNPTPIGQVPRPGDDHTVGYYAPTQRVKPRVVLGGWGGAEPTPRGSVGLVAPWQSCGALLLRLPCRPSECRGPCSPRWHLLGPLPARPGRVLLADRLAAHPTPQSGKIPWLGLSAGHRAGPTLG